MDKAKKLFEDYSDANREYCEYKETLEYKWSLGYTISASEQKTLRKLQTKKDILYKKYLDSKDEKSLTRTIW